MKAFIIIKMRFEAIHSYPDCPLETVSYLRYPHRHEFHIELKFSVSHDNRDIEFIDMKQKIKDWVKERYERKDLGAMSCEMIAKEMVEEFKACCVRVFEDGENGAEVNAE